MEEEARDILRRTVGETPPPKDLGRAIHARFASIDGSVAVAEQPSDDRNRHAVQYSLARERVAKVV